MERNLDDIAEGKLDYHHMLQEFYGAFSVQLKKAYMEHGAKECEKCSGIMKEITMKNGDKFLGCSNYPRCYNSKKIDIKSVA